MLNLATVHPAGFREIYIDLDDSGNAYIKQGDNWIAFPVDATAELIKALEKIHRP